MAALYPNSDGTLTTSGSAVYIGLPVVWMDPASEALEDMASTVEKGRRFRLDAILARRCRPETSRWWRTFRPVRHQPKARRRSERVRCRSPPAFSFRASERLRQGKINAPLVSDMADRG
jgi:hypothetical protein